MASTTDPAQSGAVIGTLDAVGVAPVEDSVDAGSVPVDPGVGLQARLEGACSVLAAVVADLDPGCLSGRDAVSLYGSIAGFERLALAGKALLGPRIDSSLIWREDGHRNAASLLASLEGISAGQAKATLDLGKQLEELPGTEEALRKGLLSRPKATELADAGILDPDREATLLSGAEDQPLAQVKERCARSRATSAGADPLATIRRIRAGRTFSSWTDPEGAFCYQGRDTADRGAKILSRLGQVTTALRKAQRSSDQPPEPEAAHRADAFFALVTQRHPVTKPRPRSLPPTGPNTEATPGPAHSVPASAGPASDPVLPSPTSGGGPEPLGHHPGLFDPQPDPGSNLTLAPADDPDLDPSLHPDSDPTGDPDLNAVDLDAVDPDLDPELGLDPWGGSDATGDQGPSPDSLAIIDRPPACSVVVRVDLAALLRGSVEPGEQCEIDGQGPIPVSMARSLTNDCYLRLVFHRAGDIKAIAHQGRTINSTLRTALIYRDRTCVVPGCLVPYGLEIDHVQPMAEGGPTKLENLALLCHHHHFLKTYEGWTLTNTGPNHEGSPTWRFDPQPPFGQEPDLGMDTPEGRERWRRRE